MPPTGLHSLVEHLRDGSLIAFIGAGTSRTYHDESTGMTWNGLPTGGEIVRLLSSRRPYVSGDLSFPQACFLFKQREGRAELEKLLLELLDRPVIQPLPAHVILANLPFAAFVTTNFDQLLERAVSDARHKPHAVVEDEDVSRLRSLHVPIVKLHGCVSRPETIIASEDEYRPLDQRSPVLASLVRTQLANKTLLFLGFALDDLDFQVAYDEVRDILKERMPRSVAVVHSASDYKREYWASKGVEVISDDLTNFLRSLLRASAEQSPGAVYQPREDWFDNAYFESLQKIRTLPSETQVIDAFLTHFLLEMRSPNFSLDDILSRARKATTVVLARRPHFRGLRRVADTLVDEILNTCASKESGEVVIQKLIGDRLSLQTS